MGNLWIIIFTFLLHHLPINSLIYCSLFYKHCTYLYSFYCKNGRIIRPFLQCKDTFFNKSFHLFEYFLFVIFNLAFLQHLFVFIHHVLLFVMFRLVFDISNNGGYLIF